MKKFVLLLLTMCICLSLVACHNEKKNDADIDSSTPDSSTAAESTSEETVLKTYYKLPEKDAPQPSGGATMSASYYYPSIATLCENADLIIKGKFKYSADEYINGSWPQGENMEDCKFLKYRDVFEVTEVLAGEYEEKIISYLRMSMSTYVKDGTFVKPVQNQKDVFVAGEEYILFFEYIGDRLNCMVSYIIPAEAPELSISGTDRSARLLTEMGKLTVNNSEEALNTLKTQESFEEYIKTNAKK